MTASIVKHSAHDNQDTDNTLCVQLPSRCRALGYEGRHANLRSRFETFLNRAKIDGFTENQLIYKSTTYLDDYAFKVVDTYIMDMTTAMAFAVYVSPARGASFIQAVVNAQPEPAPIPYFHAKTCNKRMLDSAVAKVYT